MQESGLPVALLLLIQSASSQADASVGEWLMELAAQLASQVDSREAA